MQTLIENSAGYSTFMLYQLRVLLSILIASNRVEVHVFDQTVQEVGSW